MLCTTLSSLFVDLLARRRIINSQAKRPCSTYIIIIIIIIIITIIIIIIIIIISPLEWLMCFLIKKTKTRKQNPDEVPQHFADFCEIVVKKIVTRDQQ